MSLTAVIIFVGVAFALLAVGVPVLRAVLGAVFKHPAVAAVVVLVVLTVVAFASGVL